MTTTTPRTSLHGLQVATVLQRFVDDKVWPGRRGQRNLEGLDTMYRSGAKNLACCRARSLQSELAVAQGSPAPRHEG